MEQLKKLVIFFRKIAERTKSLVRTSEERFNNSVANHAADIHVVTLSLFFLIFIFSLPVVITARSYDDLAFAFTFALLGLMVVWFPIAIFELAYLRPKVISRLKNYGPFVQYEILSTGRKSRWASVLALPFLTVVQILPRFTTVMGSGDLVGDTIAPRVFVISLVVGILLFLLSFPSSVVFQFSNDEEVEISLGLIHHVESIADRNKSHQRCPRPDLIIKVWMHLIKNVYEKCRKILEKHTGACRIDLHKPFGVVSFAFVMGDTQQRGKAKDWATQLGTTLTDKRLTEETRSEKVFSQLEAVESVNEFSDALRLYDKFGFDYQFEPIWRKGGWKTVVLSIIVDVVLVLIGLFFGK